MNRIIFIIGSFKRSRSGLVLSLGLVLGSAQIDTANAQPITVAPAVTNSDVQNYVQNVLLGSCVTASNVTFNGTANAAGTFDGSATAFGLNSGIVLTTGRAVLSIGPDNSNSLGFNNVGTGDPDLTVLASGFSTYDASILQFDFIPQSDTLRFNYIFGSEEYPEYVNSGYNDVFGFFISGPGFSGPFFGGAENIAVLPGTSIPVAIDNVNNGYSATEPATGPCDNCAYYVNNTNGPAVQYDAHTVVLTATAVVVPCQTYHIKIAVADAGDGALDSGVFLEAGSFTASGAESVELEAVTGLPGVYEGCTTGSFVFRRVNVGSNSSPVTVTYNVSGSATPGTDYTALPGSITIPAGQDSVILNINALLDLTAEGTETVVLSLTSGGCSCTAPPTVSMNILDNDIPLSLTTSGTTTICLGQSASLTANPLGSISPYTSGWNNGAPSGNSVSVSPTATTTYTFSVTDACSGQTVTSSETVTVITPSFTVNDGQQCLQGNIFSFTNTGSSGPTVSHYWTFGDGNTSTTASLNYVYTAAGNYTVTHNVIHIASGCTTSTSAPVQVFSEPSVLAIIDQNVSCVGGSNGAISTFVSGGTAQYGYLWLPGNQTTASITNLTAGNYTVNLTDANGCTDQVTATVLQNDATPPTAICQNATVQLNAVGVATISATLVDNGSSDNCGIASLVVSPNAFSCANIGANPVVLTVTDVNGNVSTCNATVTVQDLLPPVAVCQDITVQLDGSGNATITAAQVNNGSTDNCVVQTISVAPNAFNCTDVGANVVVLTVTDASGNSSNCNATVTVQEATVPVAVCQNIAVQLDASGNVSITGAQVGSASTDNCGIANISVNPSNFTCAEIGSNSVTVTVTDGSGNSATCNATVTVSDGLAPTALCQNVVLQLNALGSASLTAAAVDAGSSDNCAIAGLSVNPNVFNCGQLGPNAVVLTVTDASGNSANCSASVTIQDQLAPTAICQDVTVQLDGSGNATVTAAQVNNGSIDNCAIQSLSLTPTTFNCATTGPNAAVLTVTDFSGNSSTCNATITALENFPPVALCQNITVQLNAAGNASVTALQVDGGSSDNCGIIASNVDPSTFNCSNIGSNPVTLTVSDASGNTASCSATVTVQDNINPAALCQDVTVLLDALGTATVVPTDVNAASTDNCAVAGLSISPNSFTCSELGLNSVTLTVTDASGNSSTCVSNVTVISNISPTATCQDITVQLDAAGTVSIVAGQINNGSTDVCGAASISLDITDFTCAEIGANTVVLTVEDNSGNISTCSATVTVEDATDPTAICQDLTIYLDASGQVVVTPMEVDNGSIDNCSIASYQLSQTNFACSNTGTNAVTLSVTDPTGSSATCSSNITVLDTVFPVIVNCQVDILITPDSSDCTPQAFWATPTATDNCSAVLSSNFSSGANFNIGTTTVTYAAEDPSGNIAVCSFNVVVDLAPVAITISSTVGICGYNISCNGEADGQASALVTGGCLPYTFLWSDGQTGQTATSLAAGIHSVTVTDLGGNQATTSVELSEPAPITTVSLSSPQLSNGTNISCNGGADGAINLDVTGGSGCIGYDFTWIGPNGFSANTKDVSGLEEGTYVVTVTDANGCTHTDSITLTDPEPMVIQSFPTTYNGYNISCFGQSDGLINISVSGGLSPYTFDWSNGQTTEDIDSLSAATYSVLVTDANGCEGDHSVILTQPTDLSLAVVQSLPVSCNGSSNGQVTVLASGGVPSYSYLWSNGDVDPILNNAAIGTYQVVASDLNGCQDSLTVIVTGPSALTATILNVTNVTCFGGSNGSATINAAGGTAPYSYLWVATGQFIQTIGGLSAGTHQYLVTDANGCQFAGSVDVTQPTQIILVTSNDTTVCPGSLVPMSVNVTGGGGTYLITWQNGQGFGTEYQAYITQTTNVPVIAQDQFGCLGAPNSVIVTTLNAVVPSFQYDIIDPCVMPVSVDFSNGSTNAISYTWDFGNGLTSAQPDPNTQFNEPGTYTVGLTATSDEGCSNTVSIQLTVDDLPNAQFAVPNPNGCYPIMVGLFNQSTSANSYFWDFGDGQTSTQTSVYHFFENAGAYTVTLIASNANGCSDTLVVDSAVFAYPRPTAQFIANAVVFPEPGKIFEFDNLSVGGTEYFWSFGTGDISELFEPIYEYPEHGSYNVVLRVFNQYGCLDTAMVSVFVELTSGLFVPNAVAIGESGDAGVFLPKGAGIGQYEAWIYDNWGNMLWESTTLSNGSPSESWDGRYKGQKVPQGAYTWKINAIFKDGVVWDGMEQSNGKRKNTGSVMILY